MKPFRAHLVEQETNYEYRLCSVVNIHDSEIQDKIRLALGRYGLIELKPNGVQTKLNSAADKGFNQYPFSVVYVTTVVMSNPLSSRAAVQSVALFTRIDSSKLAFLDKSDQIVMDGPDVEQHAAPVGVDSKTAQAEVGDARVKTLVSDMMDAIISGRKDKTIEVPVYENGSVVDHTAVSQATGRKMPKGFYVVETAGDETIMSGPYTRCPENYEFTNEMNRADLSEVRQQTDGINEYIVEYHPAETTEDPADAGRRLVGQTYQAEVVDQDTGKTHTISVRAQSANAARAIAVDRLSKKLGIDKDNLIPTKPDEVSGN